MKHSNTPLLFTLLFAVLLLSGCASTGSTPSGDSTETMQAGKQKPTTEDEQAASPVEEEEPECD